MLIGVLLGLLYFLLPSFLGYFTKPWHTRFVLHVTDYGLFWIMPRILFWPYWMYRARREWIAAQVAKKLNP